MVEGLSVAGRPITMVRAGEGAVLADQLRDDGYVAMGWLKGEDLAGLSAGQVDGLIDTHYGSTRSANQRGSDKSQVSQFLFGLQIGSLVATYRLPQAKYLLGEVIGSYEHRPDLGYRTHTGSYEHVFPVRWFATFPKAALTDKTRKHLEYPKTVFEISDPAELAEIESAVTPLDPPQIGYWWVYQGDSYAKESIGGYVWAGKHTASGGTLQHHENVAKLKAGDRVFHYSDRKLRAVGTVESASIDAPMPGGGERAGSSIGWLARVRYEELTEPVELVELPTGLKTGAVSPAGSSKPFTHDGRPVQGYMYALTNETGRGIEEFIADIPRTPIPFNPLEGAEPRAWLFQANPKTYDIVAAVKALPEISFAVRQYQKQIHAGDRAIIWASGSEGGIIAVGAVLTEPADTPPDVAEGAFWRDGNVGKQGLAVRLRIENVLPRPIGRQAILAVPELQDFGVIAFANATNYEVKREEWAAIRRLIGADGRRKLAAPFNRIFASWDDAWTAFELLKQALEHLGVERPDDPLLAITLPQTRPTMSVDYASWQIAHFGSVSGRQHTAWLVIPQGQTVFPSEPSSTEAFVAQPEGMQVTAQRGTQEALRRLSPDELAPFFAVLDAAKPHFAHHAATPWKKSHVLQLAEAVLDKSLRERILSEGLNPGVTVDGIYKFIQDKRYHFPEWLVTDYVVSLATKPFVILSGISGTGKTKMAQLVAEYCAPDETVTVETGEVPLPTDGEFVHKVGQSTLVHQTLTVPISAVHLFDTLPELRSSVSVTIRTDDGGAFSGRLGNYPAAADMFLALGWKRPFSDWLHEHATKGDYLIWTPGGSSQNTTLDVRIVRPTVETKTAPSHRTALISVRADWTDNRELLGYWNPLALKYMATELLRMLLRASKNPTEPHFVVLDEMNLAKVEYYFSDFLSAMESGTAIALHDEGDQVVIEIDGEEYQVPERLAVPQNMFFTGTVNVDETTYMFSPKVLDRSNVIEFNEVDLDTYGVGAAESGMFKLLAGTDARQLLRQTVAGAVAGEPWAGPSDWMSLSADYKDALRDLNALLEEHHLHFGYRVANEIGRFMSVAERAAGAPALAEALDLQVLQKVLPKLSGNRGRLDRPLTELRTFLNERGLNRSAEKVDRMLDTLSKVGFASFVE